MKNTIQLKSYDLVINDHQAGEAFLPGSLLDVQDDDTVNKVAAANSTSSLVACENEFQGNTIRDSYSTGDSVRTWRLQTGEETLLLSNAAIAAGDYLTADEANPGMVKTAASGDNNIFQAIEASETDSAGNIRVQAVAV